MAGRRGSAGLMESIARLRECHSLGVLVYQAELRQESRRSSSRPTIVYTSQTGRHQTARYSAVQATRWHVAPAPGAATVACGDVASNPPRARPTGSERADYQPVSCSRARDTAIPAMGGALPSNVLTKYDKKTELIRRNDKVSINIRNVFIVICAFRGCRT
jgi:hypothetical protein